MWMIVRHYRMNHEEEATSLPGIDVYPFTVEFKNFMDKTIRVSGLPVRLVLNPPFLAAMRTGSFMFQITRDYPFAFTDLWTLRAGHPLLMDRTFIFFLLVFSSLFDRLRDITPIHEYKYWKREYDKDDRYKNLSSMIDRLISVYDQYYMFSTRIVTLASRLQSATNLHFDLPSLHDLPLKYSPGVAAHDNVVREVYLITSDIFENHGQTSEYLALMIHCPDIPVLANHVLSLGSIMASYLLNCCWLISRIRVTYKIEWIRRSVMLRFLNLLLAFPEKHTLNQYCGGGNLKFSFFPLMTGFTYESKWYKDRIDETAPTQFYVTDQGEVILNIDGQSYSGVNLHRRKSYP